MVKEKWINDYRTNGLRGDLVVRYDITNEKEYWIDKFIKIEIPVYSLDSVDVQKLIDLNTTSDEYLSKMDNYLKNKYENRYRIEPFYIRIASQIYKRPVSDKRIYYTGGIYFEDHMKNLDCFTKLKVIVSNIKLSKTMIDDLIIDESYIDREMLLEKPKENLLFLKLEYFYLLSFYRILNS